MPKKYINWAFNNIRLNRTENKYFVSISYLAIAAGHLFSTHSNDCPLQVLNIPDRLPWQHHHYNVLSCTVQILHTPGY